MLLPSGRLYSVADVPVPIVDACVAQGGGKPPSAKQEQTSPEF